MLLVNEAWASLVGLVVQEGVSRHWLAAESRWYDQLFISIRLESPPHLIHSLLQLGTLLSVLLGLLLAWHKVWEMQLILFHLNLVTHVRFNDLLEVLESHISLVFFI
jgi:hypothetical protein